MRNTTYATVTKGYALALGLIAVAILSSALFFDHEIGQQSDNAKTVNIAGAQRMLSHRLLALSTLAQSRDGAMDRGEALSAIQSSAERMGEGLHYLTAGPNSPAHATREIEALYFGEETRLAQRLSDVIRNAKELLADPHADAQFNVKPATILGPLLNDLDKAVALHAAFATDASRRSGQLHWLLSIVALTLLGAEAIFIFRPLARRLHDQTETYAAIAASDPLTSLLNHRAFQAQTEELIKEGGPNQSVNLIVFDLDWFKQINDAEGHQAGDVVLMETAKKLKNVFPADAKIARIGGDEFAVALIDKRSVENIEFLTREALSLIAQPIHVGRKDLRVRGTAGLARAPEHATEFDELFAAADRAMLRTKKLHKGSVSVVDPSRLAHHRRDTAILSDLKSGAALAGIFVEFQPQFRVADLSLIGCELLMRWWHPQFGRLAPNEFLPLATDHGLMQELGDIACRRAFEGLAQLRRIGCSVPRVAINLSNAELTKSGVELDYAEMLENYGLTHCDLEIEMNEDILLDRVSGATRRKLAALRDSGARIALDDFGTGYGVWCICRGCPLIV